MPASVAQAEQPRFFKITCYTNRLVGQTSVCPVTADKLITADKLQFVLLYGAVLVTVLGRGKTQAPPEEPAKGSDAFKAHG